MEEMIVLSSSTSSSTSAATAPGLRQSLQLLLEAQLPGQWWNYAIFWQSSTDPNPQPTLFWKDGHFQGLKPAPGLAGGDMSDPEWFYLESFTKTFTAHDGGVLGEAFSTGSLVWLSGWQIINRYNCARAQEAHGHGIQTLVCIPVSSGVLELASSDLIKESWSLVHHVSSLLTSMTSFSSNSSSVGDQFDDNLLGSGIMTAGRHTEHSFDDAGTHGPRIIKGGPENKEVVNNKRRGRGRERTARSDPPNQVEMERQRRKNMNERFYALRSVVPNVSRMDKASLLSDTVSYIKELRAHVRALEDQNEREGPTRALGNKKLKTWASAIAHGGDRNSGRGLGSGNYGRINQGSNVDVDVDVKFLGSEAIIRVQSEDTNFPATRLMTAVRDLGLQVRSATISSIGGLMHQDVVVRVPQDLPNESDLKSSILDSFVLGSYLN